MFTGQSYCDMARTKHDGWCLPSMLGHTHSLQSYNTITQPRFTLLISCRPMFGGLDSELRAAFGNLKEPTLSYSAKKTGAKLGSLLGPDQGLESMAQSLGDMMQQTNTTQHTDSDNTQLEKYKNMQKFMTSALCKDPSSDPSGINTDPSLMVPDFSELESLSNSQHRYQNSHHVGFEGSNVDVRPYAVGIYDFLPQYENELGFKTGDMIFLVQHVDQDWIEGELDGVRGIFPGSYVNIVVDCNKTQDSKPDLDELEMLLCDSFYLQQGAEYKVVFSFQGERAGDLGVKEGELVRVVSHSDQHWCYVRNSR